MSVCKNCNGSGLVVNPMGVDEEPIRCPVCNGTGSVIKKEPKKVKKVK
jgi:DnaJ-class molecular chaperone